MATIKGFLTKLVDRDPRAAPAFVEALLDVLHEYDDEKCSVLWSRIRREIQAFRCVVKEELSALDLIDLNALQDKLAATGAGTYSDQFNDTVQALSVKTGLPIIQIENQVRDFRVKRVIL